MEKDLKISFKLLIIILIVFLSGLTSLYIINILSKGEILHTYASALPTVILFLLTLFLILYIIIFNVITKPLKKIIEVAREIINGNPKKRVHTFPNDEIGELARAVNKMADCFIKSGSELEKKVTERTKELSSKNKVLEKTKEETLKIIRNIEETETDLEYEKDKMKAILYGMGDGVFVIDKNLKIIIFNSAAEKISGFSEKEILGKKYNEALKFTLEENSTKEEDNFIENIIQNKKEQSTHKDLLITKSGNTINVSNNASAIKDKENKIIGCVVVFRDITKEQQIDRAKTEFVSLASHQLRTPLSSINWYAEMLLAGDAGKLNKEQKQFIDEIYAGNQRMVALVNALLNVSRLELGTFMIDPTPIDLKEMAQSVIKELEPGIKEKKLKITSLFDKKLKKINLDSGLTRMIFQNLLSNAIKYTPNKGSVKLTIKEEKKNVLISVSDTGFGIPKDQQDKIFTKLFRASNVREKNTEGTGLGLYIIKSIVENSNGNIYFISEEKKGTTFFVSLPLSGMQKKFGEKKIT